MRGVEGAGRGVTNGRPSTPTPPPRPTRTCRLSLCALTCQTPIVPRLVPSTTAPAPPPPGPWLQETLTQLEVNLGTMPSITKMLSDGLGAAGVTARILEGLGQSPDAQAIKPR